MCPSLEWIFEFYLAGLRRYMKLFVHPMFLSERRPDRDDAEACQMFLHDFAVEWIRYKLLCHTLNFVFGKLNQFFISPLTQSTYDLFKEVVFKKHHMYIRNILACVIAYDLDVETTGLVLQEMDFHGRLFIEVINEAIIQQYLWKHGFDTTEDLWQLIGEFLIEF
jgi:hypothetical protein